MTSLLCDTKMSAEALTHSRKRMLKVALVRQEFVALTQDPLIAIVLNQLLYWTQRVKDFDLLLEEEQFFYPECNVSSRHGWIYKTANDLIEETMICVDRTTMRRYLKFLINQGWLEARSHPSNKWNKTSQYRLNLRKLQEDLLPLGFDLPGIDLLPHKEFTFENGCEDLTSDLSSGSESSKGHSSKEQIAPSKIAEFSSSPSKENLSLSEGQIAPSERANSPFLSTEIITENTNREHTQKTRAREEFSISEEMVALWEQHIGYNVLRLTEERESLLESLFAFHFQNDIRLWERFCLRIKASPFLMGEGMRRWRVTLDWVLVESNLIKILEGNFDDPEVFETRTQKEQVNPAKDLEKEAILASIKDPVWKNWCSQLAEGVRLNKSQMLHEPLSLVDLKQIAQAWFIECEDERLVWVGSQDPSVLRKIDDLRLKMTWVFAKEYPKARTIRTRLETSTPQTTTNTGENNAE